MAIAGVMGHQVHQRISCVVDVEEFAPWSSGTPDDQFRGTSRFRFMRLAQQSGDNVARSRIEVISWAVEIRRHRRYEVGTTLLAVGLAQFESRDFGNGVPLIGGL